MTVPGDDFTRRCVAVDADNMALGHEVLVTPGAEFIRNPTLPNIYDANHVRRIRTDTDRAFEALVAAAAVAFGGQPPAQWMIDPDTPALVAARLTLEGYVSKDALIMAIESNPSGGAASVAITQACSDADWDDYTRMKQAEWDESARSAGIDAPDVGMGLARHYRAKSPPIRYWLARMDDVAVGFCSSWEGREGVGQVEDVYVDPRWRRRGIATALVHHGVADARAHGAGPVVIVGAADDTPKTMYAAMGFRPVAVVRKFIRA